MSTLKLGFAKKSINPPLGVGLAGYCLKPERTVQSVLDEMFARAIVFDDGERKAVLITADTILIGNANVAVIRESIRKETGIPCESIMVTHTHSHSAPTTVFLRHWGETNHAYVGIVQNQIVQAAVEAAKATTPVVIGSGQTQLPGLAFNRVRKDGPVDHTLRVLAARDPQSKKLSFVLSHFGLHPVHMPTDSRYASAEFPGRATRDLERFFPGANAAFIQGTCGDIDPIRHFEGVDAVQDAGRAVADSTRQVLEGLQFDGKLTISNSQVDCDLPLDWEDARREATEYLFHGKTRRYHEGIARSTLVKEWANEILGLFASNPPPFWRVPIQALRIGNAALVAIPGEVYTLIGETIRSRSPFKDTWVVGYANGAVGYLCDPRDYPEETYGAVMTPKIFGYPPFKANSWEVVVEASLRSLKQLS